jgi:hypothetical protein
VEYNVGDRRTEQDALRREWSTLHPSDLARTAMLSERAIVGCPDLHTNPV